jgi:adenosylhomocysteine nucleosidase
MKVAILAAFRKEVEDLARDVGAPLSGKETPPRRELVPFFRRSALFAGRQLLFAITGIGKVPAASCCQFVIDTFRPDLILHCGTAGALADGVSPLDMVVAERTLAFDQGPASPTWWETDGERISGLLRAARHASGNCGGGSVLRGGIVTGDRPVLAGADRRSLAARFDALAVDMEAAAVVQTASVNGVSALVLKAVTDRADEGAEGDFKKNLEPAARLIRGAILRYVEKEAALR